ncbi:MAG: Ca2+-binding EF-hand superfamily protein [Arenicella sp.]|jgi:Ca2+-binding EF-hand superfamily protein
MKNSFAISLSTCLIILFNNPVFAHEHGDKGHKKNGKMGHMFDRTDTNQDGRLELSEFLAHAEARFQRMDIDSDGYVTPEESREAGKKMRQKHREMRQKHREMRNKHRQERNQADDQQSTESDSDD